MTPATTNAAETILVLDFGSQYAQLIARRVREAGAFSLLVSPSDPIEKLRAIAAYGNKRLPKYPDVALITETYPNYRLSSGMLGISVPAGASQAVLQGLNDLCNEAISNEPMKSALINFGFDPVPMSLAELNAYVPREQAIWREQVAIAKIEPQ